MADSLLAAAAADEALQKPVIDGLLAGRKDANTKAFQLVTPQEIILRTWRALVDQTLGNFRHGSGPARKQYGSKISEKSEISVQSRQS